MLFAVSCCENGGLNQTTAMAALGHVSTKKRPGARDAVGSPVRSVRMFGRVAALSCAILLIAWPARAEMGFASSALPRSVVATDAAYEPSHEQPQRQGHDAQALARNEDLTTAEGAADSASREATRPQNHSGSRRHPLKPDLSRPNGAAWGPRSAPIGKSWRAVRTAQPVRRPPNASSLLWHKAAHNTAAPASASSIARSVSQSSR